MCFIPERHLSHLLHCNGVYEMQAETLNGNAPMLASSARLTETAPMSGLLVKATAVKLRRCEQQTLTFVKLQEKP